MNQYRRVQRWLTRIEKIEDSTHQMKFYDTQDYIVAFFQNCWHLKDWLKNDPNIKISSQDTESFANEKSLYLKIAGDIANGSKHLAFDDDNKMMPRLLTKFQVDQEQQQVTYEILQGDNRFDVIDLAKKCFGEWEKFLKRTFWIATSRES